MSDLVDYLSECFSTGKKAQLLLSGNPPHLVEGEIRKFDERQLLLGEPAQRLALSKIIGFPQNDI